MPDFFMYLLRCADGSYYAGSTDDLEKRLGEHQAGLGSEYTRKYGPVALVYSARFQTREDARAFEYRVKGWSRAKKEALIAGDWDRVIELAKSRARLHGQGSK